MRNMLVLAGLAVVALAIGLWLLLRKGDDASAHTSTGEPKGSAAVVVPPRTVGTPTVTTPAPGEQPSLPQVGSGENPRDYVVGDVRVRDHRSGDNALIDVPPNVHPAEAPKIPSALTTEIARKVQVVMTECTANLPKDARGDKPRLEGQIIIAIKDHNVTVTKSTVQLRNITGDAVEPTKQCIDSKALQITNAAPDVIDMDDYPIHLSFAIP
ncbi:MAG TPA: hypothetical protein VIV40_35355 [Kofleriaceae bacterium]